MALCKKLKTRHSIIKYIFPERVTSIILFGNFHALLQKEFPTP